MRILPFGSGSGSRGKCWKRSLPTGSSTWAYFPVLELSTDSPRPPVQTFQGARQSLLSLLLHRALKALSQQEGVTLFMTLLAAFQTFLYRYTGQE